MIKWLFCNTYSLLYFYFLLNKNKNIIVFICLYLSNVRKNKNKLTHNKLRLFFSKLLPDGKRNLRVPAFAWKETSWLNGAERWSDRTGVSNRSTSRPFFRLGPFWRSETWHACVPILLLAAPLPFCVCVRARVCFCLCVSVCAQLEACTGRKCVPVPSSLQKICSARYKLQEENPVINWPCPSDEDDCLAFGPAHWPLVSEHPPAVYPPPFHRCLPWVLSF